MTLEETVHVAYEAWSRRDIDALLDVVHPDAEARPILGANLGVSVVSRTRSRRTPVLRSRRRRVAGKGIGHPV